MLSSLWYSYSDIMHMLNHLTYSYWSPKVSEQMYGLDYLSCVTLNELSR